MDNIEELKSKLEAITKQINEIESRSLNDNSLDVIIITSPDGVNKRIKKDMAPTYMKLIEQRQSIINQIRLSENNRKEEEPKKEDNIDYQIINRDPNFKKDSFQRINSEKTKLLTTTKDNIQYISAPFDYLRDNNKDTIVGKDEIKKGVSESRKRVQSNVKKRILVDDTKGFISSAAFIIITSVFITVMIFLVVGYIVFE